MVSRGRSFTMKLGYSLLALSLLTVTTATNVSAAPVTVSIKGTVEYNQVTQGNWRNAIVPAGSAAEISFLLDSNNFVDSGTYPVRGYAMDLTSFLVQLGSVPGGLKNPFPGGVANFVLRNNDPGVDGFYFSTVVDGPNGLPLNVAANNAGTRFFESAFQVSYDLTTLSSLDILDAIGTYDYDGLGSFYFVMLDLGQEPIGMVFESLTISGPVPVQPTTWSAVKALYR
jgi:hypothetical protein